MYHRMDTIDFVQKKFSLVILLIASNAAIFLASFGNEKIIFDYGLVGQYSFFGNIYGVGAGQWWRTITGGFLHANLPHVFMNMLLLYLLGKPMENTLGTKNFGLIYAAGLMGGSFGALLLTPYGFTVGASGAVYGLFGAVAVLKNYAGIDWHNSGLKTLLVINIIFTFAAPGVSIGGHLGGLLGGILAGFAYKKSFTNTENSKLKGFNPQLVTAVIAAGFLGASIMVSANPIPIL